MPCTEPSRGTPPALNDAAYEQIAGFFKVLADPLRIRLLNALYGGERSVTHLLAATGGNQANVSKHLRVLLDAGLVSRRKAGTSALYAIADPIVFALCEQVCDRQQAFLAARVNVFRGPAG